MYSVYIGFPIVQRIFVKCYKLNKNQLYKHYYVFYLRYYLIVTAQQQPQPQQQHTITVVGLRLGNHWKLPTTHTTTTNTHTTNSKLQK